MLCDTQCMALLSGIPFYFEPAEEGGYVVHVPALNGAATQGETLEEAREMAKDLIIGYLEGFATF
jgi:predicted RNase H-like HicB family nuclease